MDMVLFRRQHQLLRALRAVAPDGVFERVEIVSDICETVELVEDRDVVDFALFGGFAGREIVASGVVDYDEAITGLGGGGVWSVFVLLTARRRRWASVLDSLPASMFPMLRRFLH